MNDRLEVLNSVKAAFEREAGLVDLDSKIITTRPFPILVIYVLNPTNRLHSILENAKKTNVYIDGEVPIATLRSKVRENILSTPEIKLLLRVLAESQNVTRFSFPGDFFNRYTDSVSGAEAQIVSSANHVVLGRRGAGKSMLLLYAWHNRERSSKPSAWVDMQTYNGRSDEAVICDVLLEILRQAARYLRDDEKNSQIVSFIGTPNLDILELRKFLPKIRLYLGGIAEKGEELFIFIDDLHVIGEQLQPLLLDIIYSLSRGNQIFLKISAIETLTRTYDADTRSGLEIPQDAQYLRLDYNLTTPDKTALHIAAILDAHAQYAGLPSIRRVCLSADVLPRLTWVSAGVPRDALNLFSQAIQKATAEGRKRVTVSNVNVAASETLSIKLREFETDAVGRSDDLKEVLESIKTFCIQDKRKNAFLVEIQSDTDLFSSVMRLVQLRLLHIVTEGITIGEVGRKYIGLILDYGFYTGMRAAQSVDLFNRQTESVIYKDLRKLPVFRG